MLFLACHHRSGQRRHWLLIVAFIFVGGVALIRRTSPLSEALTLPQAPVTALAVIRVALRQRTLTLELARTEAERQLGLGRRSSLMDDHGMLFLFDKPGRYPFWMYRMRFPIDMIWLRQGRVVDVAAQMPAPRFGQMPAAHIPSADADEILEVAAGQAAADGLTVGAYVPELVMQDRF